MEKLGTILISVIDNVAAHYIIKWLDRDTINTIISTKNTGVAAPVFLISHGYIRLHV